MALSTELRELLLLTSSLHAVKQNYIIKFNAQQSLGNLVEWLTALCSGSLSPELSLARGSLNRTKRAAATDQLTLKFNTQQSLMNLVK